MVSIQFSFHRTKILYVIVSKSSFGLIFIESLSMQAAILQKLYSCHEVCHFTSLLHLQSVPHAVGRKLSQFGQNLRHWISNAKGFHLIQMEPNPTTYPVLLSFYARIFYWIFCCLSLESSVWGWIVSEHDLFVSFKVDIN